MPPAECRGIAVTDIGYTNMKVVLFSPDGRPVAERRAATRHVEGPPYRHIDPAVLVSFLREALPALDQILPVDVIVPSAHGATLACIAGDGSLALPVMDYTAEPPPEIVARYREIMPPFSESYCGLLPMALTHGLQLYWQSQAFPAAFARIATIVPWIQYVGFCLTGVAVTEPTAMSAQSHLVNVAHGGLSSLVKRMGWAHLFPPLGPSWAEIGTLRPAFRGAAFRGEGRVLAGIHDSSANFVRYQAAGLGDFTLLSTGTWSIAFDTATPISALRGDYDTNTNTTIFGTPIACGRFFGGKEFEILAGEAAATEPSLAAVQRLIDAKVFALPSFTGSPGPMPGTENKGRIVGDAPDDPAERVSLASLYCAEMVSEQLDCVGSRHDIIVDGPFSQNKVFLAVLAAIRPGQRVRASELRDGTTAGAACLALMRDGKLPNIGLSLATIAPASLAGVADYHRIWKEMAHANST